MGNSYGCLCPGKESNAEVVVMKENGSLISFKKGATVKEVLVARQGFRIVPCGSDPIVLPEQSELKTGRLYFLVPEKFATCKPIYNQFLSTAEWKGLLARPTAEEAAPAALAKKMKDGKATTTTAAESDQKITGLLDEELKKYPWRPGLQTIPEAPSPCKHEDTP
ncbi:hypothetical protein ACLOJK_031545 [Asimina triloba]